MAPEQSEFFHAAERGAVLFVRVTPGSKKNEIAGLWRGPGGEIRLVAKVTAPPDRGKANDAVVKLLAKALDMPKSALVIASGASSRLKTLEITGAPETLRARLDALSATLQSKT